MKNPNVLSEADLILNSDGSVYHLGLSPDMLASTILTVGDPDRVDKLTQHFDSIEFKHHRREFHAQTGRIGNKRVTVLSTGMGTDNMDIVLHELDQLVNMDLQTRTAEDQLRSLNIIRIGTTGSLRRDIACGTVVASRYAVAHDGLDYFYPDGVVEIDHISQLQIDPLYVPGSYVTSYSEKLCDTLSIDCHRGITYTAQGFYGPQYRKTRVNATALSPLHKAKTLFSNVEMETSGLYLLAAHLGHYACSLSVVLANRITERFSSQPARDIDKLIEVVLDRIENIPD